MKVQMKAAGSLGPLVGDGWDAPNLSRGEPAMSWPWPFPDGRAHGAGGSTVPSDTDAAAVSFLICTDISLGSAPPGYAAAAQAPVWAPRCLTAPPLGWPGRESGHVPFRIEGAAARLIFLPLLFRVIGHRVLTVDTPIGRKMRPRLLSHAAPLVRVRPKDLAAAKIQRVPRVAGVRDGRPCCATSGPLKWPT
jgi:hypothetical protein